MPAKDDLKQALRRLERAKQEHRAASARFSRQLGDVAAGAARLRAVTVELDDALGGLSATLREVIDGS